MNTLDLIIEPAELASQLPGENLLPVCVTQARVYEAQHIPGSVLIEPAELVSGSKPATGKLPDKARLDALFSRIGLTPETHVVAYDDEGGGWAGRLIWTLDVIGHHNYSCLNGGLVAWRQGGFPLTTEIPPAREVRYDTAVDRQFIASKEDVLRAIESGSAQIWDARSAQEYAGTKVTALRNGHIPGAVNIDWLELMDRDNDLRLQPPAALREKLASHGLNGDLPIITHCQTHHRSGLTYLAGKWLGMDMLAYDGSWSEWGNDPDTPVETGA